MTTTIKMIAFDLFGVLITESHMVSTTLMSLMPKEAKQPIVKGFYGQYTRGEISEFSFWDAIDQAGNKELRQIFLNAFVLDPDLEKVTSILAKHYQLSILSNLAKDWAEVLSDKYQFEKTFSPRIFSGAVNCEKPDAKIYNILTQQSLLNSNEILFIDDRLDNLKTAKQLGMTTVHYQRETDDSDYKADFTINRLKQLLNCLDAPHQVSTRA